MTPALSRRHALVLAAAATATAIGLPAAAQEQPAREVRELAIGDPNAPVTVYEYVMYTCPHCANFHREVYPQVKENLIDTGKMRLVFREVYFNRPSLWAAMVARCAPEDRYFGIADLLFQRQAAWAGVADDAMIAELFAIGRQAGLTDDDLNACLSDRAFAEALVADFQKNITEDGIDSTPSFVINGQKFGNMSYADFEARVNAAAGN